MKDDNIWTVFSRDEQSNQWAWALIGRGSRHVFAVGVAQSADEAAESARNAYLNIGVRDEEKN